MPSEPLDLVEAVARRPKMYTLGGTYEEVVMFLEGYISGLAVGHMSSPIFHDWYEFHNWLKHKVSQ